MSGNSRYIINRQTNGMAPLRVKKPIFIYVILLIIQIKPAYFGSIETLDTFFNIARVLSGLLILFLYLRQGTKLQLPLILLGALFLVMIISTIINGFSVVKPMIDLAGLFCILLFSDFLLSNDTETGIKVLALTFEILLYANFLTILLFPQGLYDTELVKIGGLRKAFLLGHQNGMLYILVAGIPVMFFLHQMKNSSSSRLRAVIFFTIVFLQNVIAWSATPLVFCVLVALCFIYMTIRPQTRLLTCKTGLIAMGILFYAFVMNRLQNKFSWLLVDILHRDITFSNRTVIWDTIFSLLPQHPIIGFGVRGADGFRQLLGGNVQFIHGHNQIMTILLECGFLGLSIFVFLLICFAKEVDRQKDMCSRAILCVAIPLLVASCLTEPPFTVFASCNIIFILAFRLKEIRSVCVPVEPQQNRKLSLGGKNA